VNLKVKVFFFGFAPKIFPKEGRKKTEKKKKKESPFSGVG
jgi:hypothetical protein